MKKQPEQPSYMDREESIIISDSENDEEEEETDEEMDSKGDILLNAGIDSEDNMEMESDILPKDNLTIAEEKRKLGNDQYKAQNYQAALKLYTDALLLCPNSAAYYGNRSACYMMLQNFSLALQDARHAVRLDPDFDKAYVRIAKCCLAVGDINGAESAIQKLKELFPQSNAAQVEMASLEQLKDLDSKIKTQYEQKAYRNVVFYLDNALKIAPASTRYRLMKGECLAFLGRCDEAVDYALNEMQMEPTSAEAIYLRGLCLYLTDNLDKAVQHFQHALRYDPDHAKAKAMRNKSRSIKEIKEKGNTLYRNSRYSEAYATYDEALKIDELNSEVNSKLYYNRALVNTKLKRFQDAVDDCTRVLELNSKYLKALLLRARTYTHLGKYEESVADYEQAYQTNKTPEIKRDLQDAQFALKKSQRKNYYAILGVSQHAGEDEIKKAYRKKALIHHPDRHANSSLQEQKAEELKFKEVGEAYAILTDPQKKLRYDSGKDIEEQEREFDANKVFRHFFYTTGGAGNTFQFEF